jgi:hypothetical protein
VCWALLLVVARAHQLPTRRFPRAKCDERRQGILWRRFDVRYESLADIRKRLNFVLEEPRIWDSPPFQAEQDEVPVPENGDPYGSGHQRYLSLVSYSVRRLRALLAVPARCFAAVPALPLRRAVCKRPLCFTASNQSPVLHDEDSRRSSGCRKRNRPNSRGRPGSSG